MNCPQCGGEGCDRRVGISCVIAKSCENGRKKKMKCADCKYYTTSTWERGEKEVAISYCTLTNYVVNLGYENNCPYFNADLSQYDICYNCKYYMGGGDWGLFCSHKDNYHHLGRFNDKPCKHYAKKQLREGWEK